MRETSFSGIIAKKQNEKREKHALFQEQRFDSQTEAVNLVSRTGSKSL